MRADGRTVPDGETIHTDVCIVGAGPVGIVLANQLCRAGREVVLLEQGDADGAGLLAPMATTDSVGLDYSVDTHRGGGLGGSVHKWLVTTPLGDGFGRLREFEPDDFAERSWIPHSGWPFQKQELVPYYRDARDLFEVEWPSPYPEPDWDRSFARSHAAGRIEGVTAMVFQFASPGVFPGSMSRRLDGCERALVLTNTAAVELLGGPDAAAVEHLIAATATGVRFQVSARIYVLAAGGIENARLLLNSRSRWAAGLGNQHDLVGRFFMEHPRFTAGILVPRGTDVVADKPFHAIHLDRGIPVQTKYRLDPPTSAKEELANHVFYFREAWWTVEAVAAREGWYGSTALDAAQELRQALQRRAAPADLLQLLRDVGSDLPGFLRSVHVKSRLRARRQQEPGSVSNRPDLLQIEVMAEQMPNPRSRVTIRQDRDRFGAHRAALEWHLSDDEVRGFGRAQQHFAEALGSAGLGEVHTLLRPGELPRGLHAASHHMGTTRMHRDPRHGVTDEHGRVHGMRAVYVAGSSVFPTAGVANPTLTLLALSLRLADELTSHE